MEQLEVKETHNLVHWEAAFRMKEASCPWTLTKGVLSLSYPKENLIRLFLLEGRSVVDPSRDRTENILRCQYCLLSSITEGGESGHYCLYSALLRLFLSSNKVFSTPTQPRYNIYATGFFLMCM